MANVVMSQELYRAVQNVIKSQCAFRVTGAKQFVNKADSCTIAIGAQTGSSGPPYTPDLTPVTLAKTTGSDGTTSAAPTWVYTATNLAGVQLATGLAPQHNRPKGKTMVATRGWCRLVSGAQLGTVGLGRMPESRTVLKWQPTN